MSGTNQYDVCDTIYTETNPQYDEAVKSWVLVEDATAGQFRVKAEGEKYLPMPNPDDTTLANQKRYDQYLLRAVFYNVCFKTLSAMVGVAFRKAPTAELPASIEYIKDNADGAGLSLNQQAQWTLSEVIKKGRAGLLVDYPPVMSDTSMADVNNGIRSTIKTYNAESILDWNEEKTLTGSRLNYVKIQECESIIDLDTGLREDVVTFLVLRLIDGVYSIQKTTDATMDTGERIEPRQANGSTFGFIPFIFAGSENNNPDIDQALLYDLAAINVAHYRNSADNEEASFITGQPTLAVTSSLASSEWSEQNPNGVVIGSRRGHFLGESGSMTLVQADPNNLPRELMKDKEAQMVSLGAQLVSPNSQETAYTTSVNLATNTSALSLAVGNVSDAYEQALMWADLFMSTTAGEVVYAINSDFFPAQVDAATITAWVAGIQGGVLPQTAFNDLLREANLTALTNEEIGEELEGSSIGIDLA